MLTLWSDWASPYASPGFGDLDLLRRQMDALLSNAFEPPRAQRAAVRYRPEIEFSETPDSLEVVAEVPGLSKDDVTLTLDRGTLTVSGARKVDAIKGYEAHRRERVDYEFTRSYALPCEIDAEKAQASVKDGVLRIVLPKAPEEQPRRISVLAG